MATLILPADVSWEDGAEPAPMPAPSAAPAASAEVVDAVARALRSGKRTAILLGGQALREQGLVAAGRVAASTVARCSSEVFPTRVQRGAGLPAIERLAYFPELASVQLRGLRHLILVDTKAPVSFFAYPGKTAALSRRLRGPRARRPERRRTREPRALVSALDAEQVEPERQALSRPERATGPLTAESACQAIGAMLPEGAIVSDESVTSGVALAASTVGAPRHDWLTLTGGAIGQGLPVAVGAAVASPGRPVFALQADGSALYTIQSLWTMAREQLDVTIVIFNNRSYAILNIELARVGAEPAGPKANAQFDLGHPGHRFRRDRAGFGVPARRVDTARSSSTRSSTRPPSPAAPDRGGDRARLIAPEL